MLNLNLNLNLNAGTICANAFMFLVFVLLLARELISKDKPAVLFLSHFLAPLGTRSSNTKTKTPFFIFDF